MARKTTCGDSCTQDKKSLGAAISEHCHTCNSDGTLEDNICKSMWHGGRIKSCYLYHFNTARKQKLSTFTEMVRSIRKYCKWCGYIDSEVSHCDYTKCTLSEFINSEQLKHEK